MPINTKHPDYDNYKILWDRCAIAVSGEDSIKNAGTTYLPKLTEQEDSEYKAYKERASFYAASGRTLQGLTGVVFRKKPEVPEWPESKKKFLDSVTPTKQSFVNFSKFVFSKVTEVGRYGVLVDIGKNAGVDKFPYFAGYVADSIINWRSEIDDDGKERLTLVVLEEISNQPDVSDKYKVAKVTKYRELFLDDAGVYNQRIWVKQEQKSSVQVKGEEFKIEDEFTPLIRNKKLNYIPFVFFGPGTPCSSLQKPPLLDIVNINISHYRNSADLEHGRHFTALPTPWAAGFKHDTSLYIGSTRAWVSEDSAANAGFLEYTGQGLSALEKALSTKESQMAILGARMLEEPKSAVEATDTHRIRQSGEQSVLASMAEAVESGFNILFNWLPDWMGFSAGVKVEFNKDYDVRELSPQQVTALMGLVQAGRMSFDTFFYNLKRGELIPETRTVEEELGLIEKQPPQKTEGEGLDLDDDNLEE